MCDSELAVHLCMSAGQVGGGGERAGLPSLTAAAAPSGLWSRAPRVVGLPQLRSQTWASSPLWRHRGPSVSVCLSATGRRPGRTASHTARRVLPQGPAHRPVHVERRHGPAGVHQGRHEAPLRAVGLGESRPAGQRVGGSGGPACSDRPSPRYLTGSWTSACRGAPTRRGGSTPVTSRRKHLSLGLPGSGLAPAPSCTLAGLRTRPSVPSSAASRVWGPQGGVAGPRGAWLGHLAPGLGAWAQGGRRGSADTWSCPCSARPGLWEGQPGTWSAGLRRPWGAFGQALGDLHEGGAEARGSLGAGGGRWAETGDAAGRGRQAC